jgi:hypothetical protein
VLDELKSALLEIPHPDTGQPLVAKVFEREELYHGPHASLAPDLTVVLTDWRYRTIGLHDFTTNKVISPAFGPTGDHRLEGILIATGAGFRQGAEPRDATLLDVAPTVLHLLGVPVPDDMDGRVWIELLAPDLSLSASGRDLEPALATVQVQSNGTSVASDSTYTYTDEEDAAIQQRLADLGYL